MKHFLAPHPFLAALLLAPLSAPLASAQTWMSEFPDGILQQPSLAVSDQGRVAVTKPMGSERTAVSILASDGSELVSFSVRTGNGATAVEINDALFLGEERIALCGAVNGKPYVASYSATNGHMIWENSLTGDGSLHGLDRNSLGHIIGHGTVTQNGVDETLLCSLNNIGGGFRWFRSYNPGSGVNVAHDVACLETGEMYFAIGFNGQFMVTRLTDWGHEVWSKHYFMPGGSIESAKVDIATNGQLIIGYVYEALGESIYGATRLNTDGSIFWGRRYTIDDLGTEQAQLSSVIAAPDGGAWMGITVKAAASDHWRSPGVFKINAQGYGQWGRNYGINQHEDAPRLERLETGGFAGVFKRNFHGTRVFKADEMGYIGVCFDQNFTVDTTTKSMIALDSAYTYEAFPGGLGTLNSAFSVENSEPENVCRGDGTIGEPFCDPANLNSSGQSTRLSAIIGTGLGSNMRLLADRGPAGQYGYFLIGTHMNATGVQINQGRLCLGTGVEQSIGRYNIPNTDLNSVGQFDSNGQLENLVGTSTAIFGFDLPVNTPFAGSVITSHQTWYFQMWHRDNNGSSNFSNGLRIMFP